MNTKPIGGDTFDNWAEAVWNADDVHDDNIVDTERTGRMVKARVEGATYEIPEFWIIGWLQAHRIDGLRVEYEDAVLYWHQQALLEAGE